MEPDKDQLSDLMKRFGFEEKEAQAFYHLNRSEELFEELFVLPGSGTSRIMHQGEVGSLFRYLRGELARQPLRRDYPEGWGGPKSSENDEE